MPDDDVRTWRNVAEVADLRMDDETLEKNVADCVDGWFGDRRGIPVEDFIDRFVRDYGGDGYGPDDWDMDSYDSPAARHLLRLARRYKREQAD